MNAYVVLKRTIYEEDFRSDEVVPLSVFLKEIDALNYKINLDLDEAVRKGMSIKCFECDADFEDEEVPTCYESDNIDPACLNSIYEWPCFEYEVKECEFNE